MQRLLSRVKIAIYARGRVAISAIKYTACRILPSFEKSESWVICERGAEARDNGYAFYRYMIENHPEVRIYYLIKRDSVDYSRVAAHAVAYGSMKNYWVVAKSDKIVSTHCYTALPVKSEKLWRLLKLEQRFYFLQHGIIKAKIPYLFGDRTGMRLFCCGAAPEHDYVKEHYRHPEGVVQPTGLARYDQLNSFETRNQILVMPTWRRWLNSESAFLESDYYAAWNGLICDDRLCQLLANTHTRLMFYPHYELQPYLKHFHSLSPNVIMADFDHYDVQQLLKESKLLITDQSSVYFDFAYMKKPILHYLFDAEQYHEKHYAEGYFDLERDGFGFVEREHERMVDRILETVQSGYVMDPAFVERTDAFFLYHDQQNCERIYRAVTRI